MILVLLLSGLAVYGGWLWSDIRTGAILGAITFLVSWLIFVERKRRQAYYYIPYEEIPYFEQRVRSIQKVGNGSILSGRVVNNEDTLDYEELLELLKRLRQENLEDYILNLQRRPDVKIEIKEIRIKVEPKKRFWW